MNANVTPRLFDYDLFQEVNKNIVIKNNKTLNFIYIKAFFFSNIDINLHIYILFNF